MEQFDAKFLKPFIDGTVKTLKVQCQLDATPKHPFIKGTAPQPAFELAGVLAIASTVFNGTITLCFTKQVFLTLMNNMLGESFTDISKEIESGAAELLNIIFGSAKNVLNNAGFGIQQALPSVVWGSGLKTTQLSTAPIIVLPFSTPVGEFYIEFSTNS